MRLCVLLAAVVVVSGLLPQGEASEFGASPAQAQTSTTDLCDSGSVNQFTDVEAAEYAAEYILCMRALELSQGSGGGAYGATRDLTRGQMASFLVRLWKDVLGNTCPPGGTPFADVEGTTHQANIECLYNLGITKGVTATTYGPTQPLKASQISRFLLRTYQKTDHTCPTTGSDNELDQAVNCLTELRVIPTTTEGSSPDPVNRAQMAVYVIGLWHNLTNQGLPPTPPTKPTTQPQPPPTTAEPVPIYTVNSPSNAQSTPSMYALGSEDNTSRRIQTVGSLVIPVFFCGTDKRLYTQQDLADAVKFLNDTIGEYIIWQSSNSLKVSFIEGGILAVPSLSGSTALEMMRHYESTGTDPCIDITLTQTSASHVVIIAAATWNYLCSAWFVDSYSLETAGTTTIILPGGSDVERHRPFSEYWMGSRAWEIGAYEKFGLLPYIFIYSLSGINAPHESGEARILDSGELYDPIKHSLLINEPSGARFLPIRPLACLLREQIGWPVGEDSSPCLRLPPHSYTASIATGQEQVSVSWTPPRFTDGAPVTGYTISLMQRYNGEGIRSDQTPVTVAKVDPGQRSYTFEGLIPYTAYHARVQASTMYGTNHGEYTWSSGETALVLPTESPKLVRRLSTGQRWQGEIRNPLIFDISWPENDFFDHYEVSGFEGCEPICYKEEDYGFEGCVPRCSRLVEEGTSIELLETLQHLIEGKTYTITVQACRDFEKDDTGPVGCFPWAEFTLEATRLAVTVEAADLENLVYAFSWPPVEGAVSYQLTVGECIDDAEPCYTRSTTVIKNIASTTTIYGGIFGVFERGKRYWVTAYACLPGDGEHDCKFVGDAVLTTPSR